MKRRFSEIESTNNQLVEYGLKLSQMKKDVVTRRAEEIKLASELPKLDKLKTARELAIVKIKASIVAAEKDLDNLTTYLESTERRFESVNKEMCAKEEEIEDTSTIYNALVVHKRHISAETKTERREISIQPAPASWTATPAYKTGNTIDYENWFSPIAKKRKQFATIEVAMNHNDVRDLFPVGLIHRTQANTLDSNDDTIKKLMKTEIEWSEQVEKPEVEIAEAIRVSKGLLKKYEMKRADIDAAENEKRATPDKFVVKVSIHNVQKKNRTHMMEWYDRLATAVGLHFSVQHGYLTDGESHCQFYGLKYDAQVAAYIYKLAFNRIHLLTKIYTPDKNSEGVRKLMAESSTKAAFTRKSRLSYALDICMKLIHSFRKEQREGDVRVLNNKMT